jgi:predicted DNA-binding antitoxin AbrB/MazE fold protein
MTIAFEAVYENGVLRPLTPLALPEGQLVHLLVSCEDAVYGGTAAPILAEIATLPGGMPADPSVAADQNRVLYLAAKANEGELSAEERAEYEAFIEAVDQVAAA